MVPTRRGATDLGISVKPLANRGIVMGSSMIAAAVLTAALATIILSGSRTMEAMLARLAESIYLLIALAVVLVVLAASGTLYLVSLGQVLGSRGTRIGRPGTVLSIIGLLCLTGPAIFFVAGFSILASGFPSESPQESLDRTLIATDVLGFSWVFSIAQAIIGAGLVLVSLALGKTRTFSKWISYVALASGGLAICSALPIGNTLELSAFIGFFLMLTLWVLLSSALSWRRSATRFHPSETG